MQAAAIIIAEAAAIRITFRTLFISLAERQGSADPTPCGGYAGPHCWALSPFVIGCNFGNISRHFSVESVNMIGIGILR